MTRNRTILLALLGGCLGGGVVAAALLLRNRPDAGEPAASSDVALATNPRIPGLHVSRPGEPSGETPPATPDPTGPERPPRPPPREPSGPPILPPDPSFYLSRFRPLGLAVDEMLPLLLSPKRAELGIRNCPENLVARCDEDSYARDLKPYLDTLASIPLVPPESGGFDEREAVAEIGKMLDHLRTIAHGPVGTPPMRALVKHYRRFDAPGNVVTIQTFFFTILDPHFDHDAFAEVYPSATKGTPIRGSLLELKKTYRIDGGTPRLLEVLAEAHSRILFGPRREYAAMQKDEQVRGIGMDSASGAHFGMFGGGDRFGLLWQDHSKGEGPVRSYAIAYRMLQEATQGDQAVTASPISRESEAALLALVLAA